MLRVVGTYRRWAGRAEWPMLYGGCLTGYLGLVGTCHSMETICNFFPKQEAMLATKKP